MTKRQSGMSVVRNKDTNEIVAIKWYSDLLDEAGNQRYEVRTKEELGEYWFNYCLEQMKEEDAEEHKAAYHSPVSLDQLQYEGEIVADNRTPVYYLNQKEEEQENSEKAVFVEEFLEVLTETQRRRLDYRMKNPKISLREIARLEGTSLSKIQKTFQQIAQKYKKVSA